MLPTRPPLSFGCTLPQGGLADWAERTELDKRERNPGNRRSVERARGTSQTLKAPIRVTPCSPYFCVAVTTAQSSLVCSAVLKCCRPVHHSERDVRFVSSVDSAVHDVMSGQH
jgi:hypothetical protein